ncbi:unnamed protein product [Nyctereutes procyonoides]|uniref:(raccoon dog) hypothetical protein n=1 Tax=Nyctereutes procyonoides TaxID=34880 RepID=A0A811YKQ4_NYCPR|nr:unnamed protein product [Nyctereutes procyonoides]
MPPSFSSPLPSGPDRDKCILYWFASSSGPQSEHFLQDSVAKAVPGKLQPLLEGLKQLSTSAANQPLCIFKLQQHLWDQ